MPARDTEQHNPHHPTRGVYLLANDSVYDLAVAMLNSLRIVEPTLSICLVPFDDNISKIRSLVPAYDLSLWTDRQALTECDRISRLFHDEVRGHYRKLALWEGPYEEFVYIDADSILLQSLSPVFSLLAEYEIVTGISGLPNTVPFVWHHPESSPELQTMDWRFAANTGFIASRQGVLNLAAVQRKLDAALLLKPHMALEYLDQPLLNYLIITAAVRYTSLLSLNRQHRPSLLPLVVWSGVYQEHVLRARPLPLLIHWAGEWHTHKHEENTLWKSFREARRTQSLPAFKVVNSQAGKKI